MSPRVGFRRFPVPRFSPPLLACAVVASLGGLATAQDARVVVCNSSNGQILDVDFASGTSSTIVSDSERVSMQSCVFRDDGADGVHLIVADRNGEVVFYANAAGPGQIVLGTADQPPHPNGLSQDPTQNLYGVTSSTGSSDGSVAGVWILRRDPNGTSPGGYAGPVAYIDSPVEGVDQLAETIFVTSNLGTLQAGDLLVLASDPPRILRYRSADLASFLEVLAAGGAPAQLEPETFVHSSAAAVPAAQRFPVGVTPQGMDLTQEGSLLVSAGEGRVLLYGADGLRKTDAGGNFVDFFTGLGNGQFKVKTGLQDGALRAFLSDRNGGEVHRFGIRADGTGALEATLADPQSPDGLATTTSAVELTPAGSGITVSTSSLIESTIENVSLAGATSVNEFVFTDVRESEPGAPLDPSAPLHRALDLHDEISTLLPEGVEIPAHVRAFRKADPVTGLPTGPPTFILLVVDTSAEVVGIIQHIADEALVLGYSPDCFDPDPAFRSKLFWRDNPAAGEAPIPEGTFINVTNDCGSSRGMTKIFSLFLPARDTRTSDAIFLEQFSGLATALDNTTCIPNRTKRALERSLATAQREYERNRLDRTLAALQTFQALVIDSAADFAACSLNEGGDLRARCAAAIYTLVNF